MMQIIMTAILSFLLSFQCIAKLSFNDWSLDTFLSAKNLEQAKQVFHGLYMTIEASWADCATEGALMECKIATTVNPLSDLAKISFTKHDIGSKAALALLRLKRKELWQKQYPSFNQYREENARLGEFDVRIQQFRYFHLDNIIWPVFVRAYDLIINDKTSISITIINPAFDWPILQNKLELLESSFSLKNAKR